MAGIGFELHKLSSRSSLSSQLAATTHGAVIAAGPWLFTIACLGVTSLATQSLGEQEAVSTFRVLVFYGFCLSLIASSPAIITGVRLVADAIYARKIQRVAGIFLACTVFAAVPVAVVGWLVYFVLFQLPLFAGLTAIATCVLASLVWVATAFCSATRDYRTVTLAFSYGMLCATINAIILAHFGQGPANILIGFNIGLCVVVIMLFNQVFVTFPHAVKADSNSILWFAEEIARRKYLCAGAVSASAAIWIDKIVMWNSSESEILLWGLRHAPSYDSALFVSFLCIIPALAQYVIYIETDFYQRYQKYYNDISAHACFEEIDGNAKSIRDGTLKSVFTIWNRHAAICAIFFLAGPAIVAAIALEYVQLSIFRMGVLGALFHFLFFACSSIIIFMDRQILFLRLQVLFLAMNMLLTAASLLLGTEYLGLGYFIAAMISALFAYRGMVSVLNDINYITFIANNEL